MSPLCRQQTQSGVIPTRALLTRTPGEKPLARNKKKKNTRLHRGNAETAEADPAASVAGCQGVSGAKAAAGNSHFSLKIQQKEGETRKSATPGDIME